MTHTVHNGGGVPHGFIHELCHGSGARGLFDALPLYSLQYGLSKYNVVSLSLATLLLMHVSLVGRKDSDDGLRY